MKKIFVGLASIIIVLLLIILYKVFTPYFFKLDQDGLTEVGPKINVLIIDDLSRTTEQLYKDVESGKAVLLLWIEEKDDTTQQAYTFNTLESLVRLEKNKLGFLDVHDADLIHLYVARYDAKKHTLLYSSMHDKNISMIEADRTYLIGEILSDPRNIENPAGKVIFDNEQTKELRMVKIPEAQISEATLVPESQTENTVENILSNE